MGRYLGKKINIFLLAIIVISLIGIMGMSTYYNTRYEEISNQYKNISNDLKIRTNELITARNQLVQIKGTLNQTSIDVEKYDEIYLEKLSELENTKTSLESEVSQKEKIQKELLETTNLLSAKNQENTQLTNDLGKCRVTLQAARDDLEDCRDDLDECEDLLPDDN